MQVCALRWRHDSALLLCRWLARGDQVGAAGAPRKAASPRHLDAGLRLTLRRHHGPMHLRPPPQVLFVATGRKAGCCSTALLRKHNAVHRRPHAGQGGEVEARAGADERRCGRAWVGIGKAVSRAVWQAGRDVEGARSMDPHSGLLLPLPHPSRRRFHAITFSGTDRFSSEHLAVSSFPFGRHLCDALERHPRALAQARAEGVALCERLLRVRCHGRRALFAQCSWVWAFGHNAASGSAPLHDGLLDRALLLSSAKSLCH
mmetsp:Transcript_59795/g.135096  ORF Transcript_59795/g.135096 Transcript_59795/m.135096 type:complete len:260 (-) Transcript_59795:556-1335(-)